MSHRILVGLDGHETGDRALAYARGLADLIGDCELIVAYVIEWSPYSFQTAEENAERHKRREEEIVLAKERIVDPAVKAQSESGANIRGIVRHGDVSHTLSAIAKAENVGQIVVGRASAGGLVQRVFGSSTSNLVMSASVPVTVIA